MKRLILFLFLFLTSLHLYSQGFIRDSQKGINLSTELADFGIYLYPNFNLDYKNHTFALGPTLNIIPGYNLEPKNDEVYYPTEYDFYGFHLLYQYNFRPENFLNFFIQTNLSYTYFHVYNYRQPSRDFELDFEMKAKCLAQTLGVGVKANFKESIYSSLSIDYGLNYYNKQTRKNYSSVHTIDENGRTGLIRIGFGYRF